MEGESEAEKLNKLADEIGEVHAIPGIFLDESEGIFQIVFTDSEGELADACRAEAAEGFLDHIFGKGGGKGAELIEERLGVAEAAIGKSGDELQGVFIGVDFFFFCDCKELFGDFFDTLWLEEVALGAGEDGLGDFFKLSSGEDEDRVGGRLFKDFEEGVPGGGREHVGFINNEDLVAEEGRGDADFFL